MGKMASVARGKSGGSFSSSPKSAAKTATPLARLARSGEGVTKMAPTMRGGEEPVPAVLRGAGKETDQTAHDMKMQRTPAPNSDAPGGSAGNTGKRKPALDM